MIKLFSDLLYNVVNETDSAKFDINSICSANCKLHLLRHFK